MIKRTVEIGSPSRLKQEKEQLVIESDGERSGSVPLEDLAVLILDNRQVTITQALLASCGSRNIAVIISDEKHLPVSLLLPLCGNVLHSKTVSAQAVVTEGVKNRIWKHIIRAKLLAQAAVLQQAGQDSRHLRTLAGKVRNGDPENLEGIAAKHYWTALFGASFRRNRDAPGLNALLNYGYAIIRAACARSLVATGLHPALGVHHRNQYDAFCLADDMMEPLRPLVDRTVFHMGREHGDKLEINRHTRQPLLELLAVSLPTGQKALPLMTGLHQYAAGLRKMLFREVDRLMIPRLE